MRLPSILLLVALATMGPPRAGALEKVADPVAPTASGREACSPAPSILCLNSGRFRVEVSWRDFRGQTGSGTVVAGGAEDSGLFWFFDAENWELLVKVLNGCEENGHFWVFAAATTDVEYLLTVTDTESGELAQYTNPLGTAADAITDAAAFATCP